MNVPVSLIGNQRVTRVLARGAFYFILLYLGVVAMFLFLQRRLIYYPNANPVTPAEVRLDESRVKLMQLTSGDAHLYGWWCSAKSRIPVEQRRVVLLFPGNAGNRGNRASLIEQWNDLGCDVVIYDYRGYGGSSGHPSEHFIAMDARNIWNQLTGEHGIAPERIILCGQSLGGGVATRLAWDLSHEQITPGGLVIRSSFTSLVDAGKHHYPWLPVSLVLVDRYPSVERLPDVHCPLIIFHGERDFTVPFSQGKTLFSVAAEESHNGVKKRFVPLPRAGHNDVMHLYRQEITGHLRQFLADLPPVK